MTSLNDVLEKLEDKLEDLHRDTKFCVNNYDYHHKNNENEIIQNLQEVLKDSLYDGKEFLSCMENMRSLIGTAHKTCSKIDELLFEVGVCNNETQVGDSAIGSDSFNEEEKGY